MFIIMVTAALKVGVPTGMVRRAIVVTTITECLVLIQFFLLTDDSVAGCSDVISCTSVTVSNL